MPNCTLAEVSPSPAPTPSPFRFGGCFRSYYFTRQNASNNPGARFDFTPHATYSPTAVNQTSWNSAINLYGVYNFPSSGWSIGGAYLYANAMDGPCVVAANHLKGAVCVTQVPPSTNPDDTLPGFTLSSFYEAYLNYKMDKNYHWKGTLGNQLFNSPWAKPADSRLKPAAFEGGDLGYTSPGGLTLEGADMLAFENRTSSDFSRQTLLTSHPTGAPGLPANISVPGGRGINTNGFAYGKVGYAPSPTSFSAYAYFYGVSDLVTMWWFEGRFPFDISGRSSYIALQSGFENNAGRSYIGKIDSQVLGARLGVNLTKNLIFTGGYDSIPWHTDTIGLPKNVTCKTNYQIMANGATLAYFLPTNAAECFMNTNGTAQIYYGGWASPYTDGYAADPLFTQSASQSMVDRRSPGPSWKVGLTYTSPNQRFILIATDAWYDYGNALAPENTQIWVLDGSYYFYNRVGKSSTNHGLMLRYRYIQRQMSNTFCGAAATICPPGLTIGSTYLGGLPLFKYNRAQLEYDF